MDPVACLFDRPREGAPDDEKWMTSRSKRRFAVLRKGIARPFFTTNTGGISVVEIKAGADLERPCWVFTYSGRFHEYGSLDELKAGKDGVRSHLRDFKFSIFVFAEE